MMKNGIALAMWSMLALGCVAEEALPSTEVQEVVKELEQAGVSANDIVITDGEVYVGQDAETSLAASPEMFDPGESCTGRTTPGATAWQQVSPRMISVNVDTSACGYKDAPLYITSLGGKGGHWLTTGATSIYAPTATGFQIQVYAESGPITPADANARHWHVNWHATPKNLRRLDVCTGSTTPGATAWQQTGAGIYVDVNTSACGYTQVPRYFTSLGGSAYHRRALGTTSIYEPTITGFRVYVFHTGGAITASDANAYGWHINWQAMSRSLRLPDVCTGGTLAGVTGWQQFGTQGLYLDVYTSPCGYTTEPRYFTSLSGSSYHRMTIGATSIYSPTATGFRVFVFDTNSPITPADANAYGWRLNWLALPE